MNETVDKSVEKSLHSTLRNEVFDVSTIDSLRQHLVMLKGLPTGALMAYRQDYSLVASKDQALRAITASLAMLRRENATIAARLRVVAEGPRPERDAGGTINLAGWLGSNTAEWHMVFEYSDDDPSRCTPWFRSLSEEEQRICLLLVAHALEDE